MSHNMLCDLPLLSRERSFSQVSYLSVASLFSRSSQTSFFSGFRCSLDR
uniref:Uncharacterized protein n=1 Tax=Manihot esculenta TaxID=3983 RepID=A0A2C9UJ60_MANES